MKTAFDSEDLTWLVLELNHGLNGPVVVVNVDDTNHLRPFDI
jgi:hypothetical protein